ncbi:hypothetical protein C8R42DRAFT_645957 [Lentinula raphanica]|nr:hypothetical protein C8R42DRAFT_645957 [Lentinula raphanica]
MTTNISFHASKGFLDCPLDILLEIVTFLLVSDALNVLTVSRKLHTLRFTQSFWHILIQTLRLSSVPLACPLHFDPTQDLEELVCRTVKRHQTMLSSRPQFVRLRSHLLGHLRILEDEPICHVSGTRLYLTYSSGDGMASCWDLLSGNVLSKVYVGGNILAKTTLSAEKGKFLICLLAADSINEFVASSAVVLSLEYHINAGSHISDVHMDIHHHEAIDASYPAMYPSCAMNEEGLLVIAKMAIDIHLVVHNLKNGLKAIFKTGLTENDVDFVDVSFDRQDLIMITSSSNSPGLYRYSKDDLPYTSDFRATKNPHRPQILPLNTYVSPELPVFCYERCAFYANGSYTSNGNRTQSVSRNSFATTAYRVISYGKDIKEHYTECCFWDFNPLYAHPTSTEPVVHKCRLPGLPLYQVACTGSESGTWGVFICDTNIVDDEAVADIFGHDFEVEVDVQYYTPPVQTLSVADAEIFLVHYDPSTRTSSVHRPVLPSSLPGVTGLSAESNWLNNIKALEIDERLGILYIMVEDIDGDVLCTMEFL